MSKLLLVIGATGLQGGAVVDYFLKHEPTYRIRGTTRNPSSEAAVALAKKGVEVVQADLNDVDSLRPVFAGANVIFAYTDFAGCMQTPAAKDLVERGVAQSLGKAGAMVDVQQGKRIADVAAGLGDGLERLIWSSLPGVKKLTGGKYANVAHFDGRQEVWEYMKGLPGLEGRVSAVIMGLFADNILRLSDVFPMIKQPDGSFVQKGTVDGKVPLPFLDVKADLGAFVSALIKAPGGLQVLGSSEEMTSEAWLDLWASHNGLRARLEKIPAEVILENDHLGMGLILFEVFQYVEEFGYSGGDPDILSPDEFEKTTGVKISRTKMIDYIENEDWSAVL